MAAPECCSVLYHLSELRIVLLGYRGAGKSLAGNAILGREEFPREGCTAQCERRQGEVAGRRVTAVVTPGWRQNCCPNQTSKMIKEQIELSVSLCPPGPHALLMVIPVDRPFLDINKDSVQGHLELLSKRVWCHTMVLFTFGDWLGDTPIEQHIESEGESLQWLVEKCGNRYHVLNNQKRDDHMQVTQLMEKIEEMVAENSGQHYGMERWRIELLEERRGGKEERVSERKMKVKKQRESLRSLMGKIHLSGLRIMLLGYLKSGKSSSGNTILGKEEFVGRTAQCVKRQGEVAGRQITVVEAPGWWRNFTAEQTSKLTKKEIELSVSLCTPGPHALLLVMRVDEPFTETERRSVQEHLELLSERVWSHTIVLFTCRHNLGDTPIEQYIESEGESLQWLVEKCGNRYHVLNNKKRDNHMQVTQLMEKIEEMVAENRGQHYEMDRQRIGELQKKRRKDEERVKERMLKVKKQRGTLRSLMGEAHRLSELRILMLGYRRSGKSSSGNTILGRDLFGTVGRTAQCVKEDGEVAGRQVTVVEAPGWWGNHQLVKTPVLTKEEIEVSVSFCFPGPHTILLVILIDQPFTETYRKSVQEHLELLSERVWSHTIVLFTNGDWLGDTPIEQHIESEGESLQWLVEKCGNRYHVLNNQKRDDHMQVTQLMEKIEEMVAENRGQHYEMDRQRIGELEKKRTRDEERVKERKIKVKRHGESLRSQMGESHHLSELRIVLLGYRYAGKSSSGNTILGREEFVGRTAQCVKRQGEVAGRQITIVEAPGWWGNHQLNDTPELDREEIEHSVSLCPGPHALLLVICVDTAFKETERVSVQQHLELLSERVWSHTIVLFTHGDWLGDTPIEQHIESEGESLQWLVEKCGNRYHVLNNQKGDDHMQVTQLMEKIEEMVAENGGQHFETDYWALSSYAYSSFKSQAGSQKQETLPVKRADSCHFIKPDMSEDSRSLTSSAYSSIRSLTGYDISSVHGSVRSLASSQSSGYASVTSRAGSVHHSAFERFRKKALGDLPE